MLPFGINPHGDVAGDSVDSIGDTHGFLPSRGNFTIIDAPGPILTDVNGINARGEIMGDYIDRDGNGHGFLLR
jgi:hypothetical protein